MPGFAFKFIATNIEAREHAHKSFLRVRLSRLIC